MVDKQQQDRPKDTYSPFLPLLLIAATLLILTIFQSTQLIRERSALNQVKINQDNPIQESQKVRSQLESIAKKTAQLAEQGNPNARLIVEELKKSGVTINPNFPSPSN